MGGGSFPLRLKGAKRVTVYEALVVAISFGTLIVAVLSFNHKK